jgi:cell division protein FtsZ
MLFEVDEAVNRIRAEVDPDANILFGSALSEDMEGRVRVSVVATGIDADTCIRLGDNVQRLNVRRRTPEVEVPAAPPPPAPAARAHFEPIVRQQVANLMQEYTSAAEAALAEAVAADPTIPIIEEPMTLGGIEAPIMEEPRPQPAMREFAPMSAPVERERRGMFGLFGGRRRSERVNRNSEPVMERRRMMPNQPEAQPVARAPQMPPVQPAHPPVQATQAAQPAQPQAPAPSRPSEVRPQGQAPGDDLFAGVSEDDRFEIPAFLRRQAKM